eukprot:11224666-Lingulodinium_polyedra.AAC.1
MVAEWPLSAVQDCGRRQERARFKCTRAKEARQSAFSGAGLLRSPDGSWHSCGRNPTGPRATGR